MAKPIDLGPAFFIEWRALARRWQGYAARSLFVAGLVAGLAFGIWVDAAQRASRRGWHQTGFWLFAGITSTQLALVLLLAPATTAGSVCLDATRGALAHLLVTELSSAEIVLAKLCARLLPVLGLLACGLPVMILAALLGGVEPDALLAGSVLVAATAVLCGSLGLALSVWANRTDEALLGSYAVLVAWIAACPAWIFFNRIGWVLYGPPNWLTASNPVWLIEGQVWAPGHVGWVPVVRLAAGLFLVSVLLTAMAIVSLRPVATRRPSLLRLRRRKAFASGWLAPSLDRNPLFWREWQRRRATGWVGMLWILFDLCALAATGTIVILVIERGLGVSTELASLLNGLQVAAGMLLLIVTATTTLADERSRGGLDVLLSTPLESRSIVLAKWWGAFRTAPRLALLPAVSAFAVACRSGRFEGVALVAGIVLCYGAALASLGLALAVWVPHPGRAATAGVAVHVLNTVGWFFLVVALMPNLRGATGPGLASGSPFIAVSFATIVMQREFPEFSRFPYWLIFWMTLELALAAMLLAATLATFDRCVGRSGPRSGRRLVIGCWSLVIRLGHWALGVAHTDC
jgi:ABC-type transport system involved in multi-copper enzyme maturation permease subunit